MNTLQRLRCAAIAAALVLAGLSTTMSQPAAADDPSATTNRPPVAVDDDITVYRGDEPLLDLVANDSDPNGDALAVCRVGDTSSKHLQVFTDDWTPFDDEPTPPGLGRTYLIVDTNTPTGTYTFPYQVCDTGFLTAATVTVQVRSLRHVTVARARRPGYIRVHNPSGFRADFTWASPRAFDFVKLPAHRTKVIPVLGHRINWSAWSVDTGPNTQHFLGKGLLRHIAVPRSRPGTPATHRVRPRTAAATPTRPLPRDGTATTSVTWPPSTFTNPDPATTQAPVTSDDTATVWSGNRSFTLIDNDTDPEGVGLDVCRVDLDSLGASRLVPRIYDGGIALDSSHAAAGTYTLTYYACNAHRLTPGTLTVTVRRTHRLQVTSVPGHLSHVLVTNPNEAPATILLDASVPGPGDSTSARIPANGSKYVPFRHRWGSWTGVVGCGGNAGHGDLRNIPLTRADAAADESSRNDGVLVVMAVDGC